MPFQTPWFDGITLTDTLTSNFPFTDTFEEPPANGLGYSHKEVLDLSYPGISPYTYESVQQAIHDMELNFPVEGSAAVGIARLECFFGLYGDCDNGSILDILREGTHIVCPAFASIDQLLRDGIPPTAASLELLLSLIHI